MEIPFDAPRWNCKFLKRKKKENWSAHSRFFYGGSNSKPGKHWESTSKNFSLPDVLFRFDGQANQTLRMILEIFRVDVFAAEKMILLSMLFMDSTKWRTASFLEY